MERLTFDGLFCDIAKCDSTPGGTFCESGTCTQRRVWERLKEYEDAEQDGRMVVLPCKVGDTIWIIVTKRPKLSMPEFSFVKRSRLTWLNMHSILQGFGKTAFLTREEAEAALKGGEG